MKNMKALMALLILVLLLTATFVSAQTDGIKMGGNVLQFDKVKFKSSIDVSLYGNVTGYQVILIKDGKIVSEIADGYARNMADGNNKMTVNTPSNIGSVLTIRN